MHLNTLCTALATIVLASATSAQTLNLSSTDREEIVTAVAELYRANYHDRTRGADIAADLLEASENGDYTGFDTAEALAAELSEQVARFDRHAHVVWTDDDGEVEAHHNSDWSEYSRRLNHGVERIARLPGNIGLVRLRMLSHPDISGPTIEAAFAILENADALILDLRANGGGEPDAVIRLASYLLGDEPVSFNSVYWADRDETEVFVTNPQRQGSRLHDIPLVILTTAATGSAAESFVDGMKRSERGVVIGQTTYGARNPGRYFEARHGFHAFVSYGRPGDSENDQSWAGTGIRPHLETAGGAEMSIALDYLWTELARDGDQNQRFRIEFARERMAALNAQSAHSPADLAQYVAVYGNREVSEHDGELYYRRDRRPLLRMIPAGEDRFYVEEFSEFRIEFIRDSSGHITRMDVPYNDGHVEPNNRSE